MIRRALLTDATALAILAERTFCDTFAHLYNPEDLQTFLEESYSIAVIEAEIADPHNAWWLATDSAGETVGYAKLRPCQLPVDEPLAEGTLELQKLYFLKEAQGTGVAQAMMETVLDFARAHGRPWLYLNVWEENYKAQRFYTKYGFKVCGEYVFRVGTHGDRELIMRLALYSASK